MCTYPLQKKTLTQRLGAKLHNLKCVHNLGKKNYRVIGLVEVMWKVVAAILNLRLTASITFHNILHGFWVGCGTGTGTLEAKLLQQLVAFREEVLFLIFLDLHKAYYALYRSRCLEILEGYGVGP